MLRRNDALPAGWRWEREEEPEPRGRVVRAKPKNGRRKKS
jgi:hypothetical protein